MNKRKTTKTNPAGETAAQGPPPPHPVDDEQTLGKLSKLKVSADLDDVDSVVSLDHVPEAHREEVVQLQRNRTAKRRAYLLGHTEEFDG